MSTPGPNRPPETLDTVGELIAALERLDPNLYVTARVEYDSGLVVTGPSEDEPSVMVTAPWRPLIVKSIPPAYTDDSRDWSDRALDILVGVTILAIITVTAIIPVWRWLLS